MESPNDATSPAKRAQGTDSPTLRGFADALERYVEHKIWHAKFGKQSSEECPECASLLIPLGVPSPSVQVVDQLRNELALWKKQAQTLEKANQTLADRQQTLEEQVIESKVVDALAGEIPAETDRGIALYAKHVTKELLGMAEKLMRAAADAPATLETVELLDRAERAMTLASRSDLIGDKSAARVEIPSEDVKEMLEAAWGVIANVAGGDWKKESDEWLAAASRWRERYLTSGLRPR